MVENCANKRDIGMSKRIERKQSGHAPPRRGAAEVFGTVAFASAAALSGGRCMFAGGAESLMPAETEKARPCGTRLRLSKMQGEHERASDLSNYNRAGGVCGDYGR